MLHFLVSLCHRVCHRVHVLLPLDGGLPVYREVLLLLGLDLGLQLLLDGLALDVTETSLHERYSMRMLDLSKIFLSSLLHGERAERIF